LNRARFFCIKVVVLDIGGLYFQRALPEADQINFLPRVTAPVLMLNGRYDYGYPVKTSQLVMFRLLGTPKENKRLKIGLLLVVAVLSSCTDAPAQLTQVPPKPTCTIWLSNGACANLWNTYNQALAQRTREEMQIYVNRQKELASAQATAPLERQIVGLTKLTTDPAGSDHQVTGADAS
jgi:hypothetical protein